MTYELEELLPVVAWLTRKFTSGESTSVTYERAEKLMEAAIYCIDLYEREEAHLPAAGTISAKEAYDRGYVKVLAKAMEALDLYHNIMSHFRDYGNVFLQDTMYKGMPEFFKRYDARFAPQDELLTLDYPAYFAKPGLRGVEAIYEYLRAIDIEQTKLATIPEAEAVELWENYNPDYRETPDNLWEIMGIMRQRKKERK